MEQETRIKMDRDFYSPSAIITDSYAIKEYYRVMGPFSHFPPVVTSSTAFARHHNQEIAIDMVPLRTLSSHQGPACGSFVSPSCCPRLQAASELFVL